MGVTNVATTANGVNVQHNSGTSLWNPPNPVTAFINPVTGLTAAPAYGTSAQMLPLGTFSRREYQALCNSLVFTDLNTGGAATPSCTGSTFTNATPLAANVVNIQAQYGVIPSSLVGGIACWVNATGASTNACDASDWSSPTLANTKRIEAIHLAVTVISPQIEKPNSTGACTATASTAATNYPVSWPGGPTIDVTTLPNWKCYRYKVFQTIIPIRNAIWAN